MVVSGKSPPSDLAILLSAGREVERGLMALSGAESLTDDLAIYILEQVGVKEAYALVRTLHFCNFVVERNSEWHLADGARQYLLSQLAQRSDLAEIVHGRLLELTRSPGLHSPVREIPRYLREGPGKAYHVSFFDVEAGLDEYSILARLPLSGQQWLASRLAREQQDMGILPKGRLELDFLQGMVYYREGRMREAEGLLRRVADAQADRLEVAIASHLVGRLDGRRGDARHAEERLLRSIAIGERLNEEFHVAQVLNTLGQLVGRDRTRTAEAEALLGRSVVILEGLGDAFSVAQVLHTLGHLVGRDRKRTTEAEELLRRSLAIGERLNETPHVAQVLHTLGQVLGRDSDRTAEAERLLRRSLEMDEARGDQASMAQVLHTLGQLIGRDRDRTAEAERLLRRSLEMDEARGDQASMAQVLHTLGQLIGRDRDRTAEAEELLGRSLRIGEIRNNKVHQAQVLYSMGQLRARFDKDAAIKLLRRSLTLNEQLDNRFGVELVRRELRRMGVDT